MQLNLAGAKKYDTDPKVISFYQRAIEQLRALPGVESAGAINYLPFNGPHSGTSIVAIEGQPKLPAGPGTGHRCLRVDANYFQTMQIPLKRGRLFTGTGSDGDASRGRR
jgi:putative ABC transport system permease protein